MNTNELTFGIELETTIPAGLCEIGGYHRGVQVPFLPAGWLAERDASIQATAGRVGCEFVSPVLKGAEGLRQALEVVAILKARGAEVNASCGFHVHVGFAGNSQEMAKLVTLVANFEKAIFAATGTKSRERGIYCNGLQRHGNAANAERASKGVRYHVLNLTNIASGRRPAVEFRAFAGTLNATKVAGYISLCLGLVERAAKAKRVTNFTAKKPVESSPIARGGEGQTALNRLFYQLGWTKGRTNETFGILPAADLPAVETLKGELMRLAKKYDAQP